MPYSPRARYRHSKLESKAHFARGSFRTIRIGRHGKRLVVGCPKGQWNRRRCRSGMRRVTMLTPKRSRNPRKYTVATAPKRVRMKWLKKAIAAKKYYAKCRRKYGVQLHRAASGGHMSFACGSGPGPVIPPPPPPRPSAPGMAFGLPRSPHMGVEDFHTVGENPELLVMTNPVRRYSRGVGSLRLLKRRRPTMRRRRRNYPVTARVGGRKHTWKKLVKKYGVKGAAKFWRRSKRYHGYTKTRCMNRSRRSRRSHRRGCNGRRGCRKGSYRALVRRHGVKIAARMWRKRSRR